MNKYQVITIFLGFFIILFAIFYTHEQVPTQQIATEEWGTYYDTYNGWQIDYPKNVSEIGAFDEPGLNKDILETISFNQNGNPDKKTYSTSLSVTVYRTTYSNLQDFTENKLKDTNLVLDKNIKVDGIEGVVLTQKSNQYSPKILFLINNHKLYVVNTSWTLPHEKIWNSFKFL